MPAPNQLRRLREDVQVTAANLIEPPPGTRTEAGLRLNIRVGIRYLEAWLNGQGAVPIYNLMEDAATAEISRTQIWQWIHHGATLEDGRLVTQAVREAADRRGSDRSFAGRDAAVRTGRDLGGSAGFSDAPGLRNPGQTLMNIHNRWFQLVASLIAMIMIANLQYSWTLFVKPMQNGHRLEALRHSVGVHAVHPVSDLGAAGAGLADRSPRPAQVHHRRGRAVRHRLGRTRVRDDAADAVRAVRVGRHRRRAGVRRLHRVGAEVVQQGPRTGVRHHGGRVWRRHGALHPVHRRA